MRRHEALIPLTHDHHHGLAQARRLRLAAKTDDEARLEAAKAFLRFFRDDTLAHFRDEEERVFPLAVEAPECRPTLERVVFEHLQIHALARVLQSDVDQDAARPPHMVRLADVLEGHIRFEEKVVFPLIERIAADVLSDLALVDP
ncbi:MAG: hemerythrin domain-containing protein [Actinomycetota bacterium]